MTDPISDPKSWEAYFKNLVRLSYGAANFKDMPDAQRGDLGIECYTFSGHVFQCYLPEQHSDVGKLVEAQKKKIQKDILKFTNTNTAKLKSLFGDLKISRWILATPYNKSSELARYCTDKSVKVRELNLEYVADDFQILIQTAEDYPVQVEFLSRDIYQLSFDFDSVSLESVHEWVLENSKFLEKMNIKIPKVVGDENQRASVRAYLVQKYLDYENLKSELETRWPTEYQKLSLCIENRESHLASRFLTVNNAQPNDVMSGELSKLEADLLSEVKALKPVDIENIKYGVLSDWLIRCPLDF